MRERTTRAPAQETSSATLFQRVASWILVSALALTIIGFIAALLHAAFGSTNPFFGSMPFAVAFILPLICLPLAVVSLVSIVVAGARQKSQQRR